MKRYRVVKKGLILVLTVLTTFVCTSAVTLAKGVYSKSNAQYSRFVSPRGTLDQELTHFLTGDHKMVAMNDPGGGGGGCGCGCFGSPRGWDE